MSSVENNVSTFVPFQVLPYWGNPHDRKVIRKFWSQVIRACLCALTIFATCAQ